MRALPILAGLAFAFSGAAAAPALAAFPGVNGHLAVSARFGCDGFQIDTMARDGSARRRLTVSPCSAAGDGVDNSHPDWSADGRRLVFVSTEGGSGFATMAADGGDRRATGISPAGPASPAFVPAHFRPSLSPDGGRFAFTRGGAIWTARLDGSEQRRLRPGIEPRFSPSGRRIAYIAVPRAGARELWLMDARTGERVRRLSKNANEIDWSPDGRRIVFARHTHGSNRDLFIARADGRAIRRFTETRSRDEGAPVFSPDGRFIAFARGGDGENHHRGDIAYKPVGGGKQRRVVTVPPLDADTAFEAQLSWGPRAE